MGTTTADNLAELREAIARGAGIVLSLPTPAGLRHFKSRFLADAGDGFWVKSVPADPALLQQLITDARPAGVAFRHAEAKIVLAAEIQHLKPDYELAGDGLVEALLLRIPSAIKTIHRRGSFRVPVPPNSELVVRVWVMSETATLRDKPAASRELKCEPRDLSAAGIGLTVIGRDGKPAAVTAGDRVRVELSLGDVTAVLEGRVRHPEKPAKAALVRIGVQFKALGESKDDRHAITQLGRIVSGLERENIRRRKLGIN